jgi:hypothetical protein
MMGHCLCGKVHWTLESEPTSVHHCHCSMCRRWTGAAFVTLVWVRRDAVKWLGEDPKVFRSSPIAIRTHCNDCGTPIYLAYDAGDEIAFAAGTIENAESLIPTHHYGVEGQLSWADIGADLPKERSQETW